ncbi:hypothetical protein MNBD_GAMMA05-92 [hydrothermal vent metagenome]|uniref:Uncharacterized protein n=1 Tax=hydrothermal vent metagenome TaxID=652676 RepID=A0A3B0X520_9ZZZZ
MPKISFNLCLILASLLFSSAAVASDIVILLEQKQAPAGVVFEIVSDDEDLLEKRLPTLKKDIEKLRKRFPNLPIAIVTHGKEQFSLITANSKTEQTTHSLVKDLVKSNDIDFHVCETHASWYGITPEDFPDYIDVSTTGPAQINDYEEMGYELIVLTD